MESWQKQVCVKEKELSSTSIGFEEARGDPGGGKGIKWGFGPWEEDWEREVHAPGSHVYTLPTMNSTCYCLHRGKKRTKTVSQRRFVLSVWCVCVCVCVCFPVLNGRLDKKIQPGFPLLRLKPMTVSNSKINSDQWELCLTIIQLKIYTLRIFFKFGGHYTIILPTKLN